jgi:hypothetical protein
MNNAQALKALIAHVDALDKPVLMGWDEVIQWPEGLLKQFLKLGLVTKDVGTKSLTCVGCEHHCVMDVRLTEDAKRAFIVCDHPDMQSHMGRIAVHLERLQQWQLSTKKFAAYIAGTLGFDAKPTYSKEAASYKLGMLKGKEGRRWVTLLEQPLRLEIAGHVTPLEEILFFDGDALVLDVERVQSMLASTPAKIGKAYTANTNKQDARKLATQAMYQDWRDEYQSLLLKSPNQTDKWYANKIAKLPIAQEKQPETIRKHMKT